MAKSTKAVAAPVHPLTGRSKEAGMKIVVADKSANRTREGSKNELFFQILEASKTTDDAVVKIREHMNKPWDIVRMAVARGYIRLEPIAGRAGKAKAEPKTAPARKSGAKPLDVAKSASRKRAAKPAEAKADEAQAARAPKTRTGGRRKADKVKEEAVVEVASLAAQAAQSAAQAASIAAGTVQ